MASVLKLCMTVLVPCKLVVGDSVGIYVFPFNRRRYSCKILGQLMSNVTRHSVAVKNLICYELLAGELLTFVEPNLTILRLCGAVFRLLSQIRDKSSVLIS